MKVKALVKNYDYPKSTSLILKKSTPVVTYTQNPINLNLLPRNIYRANISFGNSNKEISSGKLFDKYIQDYAKKYNKPMPDSKDSIINLIFFENSEIPSYIPQQEKDALQRIFGDKINFTVDDYNKMLRIDKKDITKENEAVITENLKAATVIRNSKNLRNYTVCEDSTRKYMYNSVCGSDRTLQACLNASIDMFNQIKTNLDKKYGKDEWAFVSIGRSPSVFANMCEISGIPSLIMPFSKENIPTNIKEYLEQTGFNDFITKYGKNNIIFTDYSYTGKSLKDFQNFLNESSDYNFDCDNGNLKNGQRTIKCEFHSLNELLLENSKKEEMEAYIEDYLKFKALKVFSPTINTKECNREYNPKFDVYAHLNYIKQNVKLPMPVKLFQFYLIDNYVNNGGKFEREKKC